MGYVVGKVFFSLLLLSKSYPVHLQMKYFFIIRHVKLHFAVNQRDSALKCLRRTLETEACPELKHEVRQFVLNLRLNIKDSKQMIKNALCSWWLLMTFNYFIVLTSLCSLYVPFKTEPFYNSISFPDPWVACIHLLENMYFWKLTDELLEAENSSYFLCLAGSRPDLKLLGRLPKKSKFQRQCH